MRALGIGLLAWLAAATAAGAAEPQATRWYSIVTDAGQVIGHASRQVTQKADGREIVDEQVLLIHEPPGPALPVTSRTVTREDRFGQVRWIRVSSESRRGWTRTEASIAGEAATIVRDTPSGRTTATVQLPPDVRFDNGEGLLRHWNPAAAPKLEYLDLDAEAGVIERIVIEALPGGGAGRTVALRKRYENGELRGVARVVIDGEGRIVSQTQAMFGTGITIALADRQAVTARKTPYRVLAGAMTKSPFRIGQAATRGHIRYRFGYRDGILFDLPQTGEQRARLAGGVATVDICDDCGPGLPSDPAALAEARKPTAWLQSDHPRLKAIAAPYAAMAVPDARKMALLTDRTRTTLKKMDFTGHYSALDTLSRKAGDCTEAAVLLAALGRAAGIPTRVVNGVVYSRERYHGVSNVFMPHSWVLAYVDGEWRSYDAALETFDSTHIALTVGDGDARSIAAAAQLASLLEWREMAQVRARGAP